MSMHIHSEPGLVVPFRAALSVNEFCAAFGIGRTLFYRLKNEGKIRFIKVGRRTLIPWAGATDWMDQSAVHPATVDRAS
ncbi:MAG: excisionase family DNA-binding protein [Holophaga sp.]|nr:excisionase family DNA-binding protein [Holophaga sp.]